MTRVMPLKRATFRHGSLPDALLTAALLRIETHGADSITLRDLARDTGVNHRAIYRHFPNKESLLADVAERCWKEFGQRLRTATAQKAPDAKAAEGKSDAKGGDKGDKGDKGGKK